jgi:hypothetical protein
MYDPEAYRFSLYPAYKVSMQIDGTTLTFDLNKLQVAFYAPVSKDRGHIVFGLSVRLSVCLSAKNFKLACEKF